MSVPHRIRKKPMSDINVVPYIDVMLVLLVIFMITAPLLTTGVDVDLPQAAAEPMNNENEAQEPVIVTVGKLGDYYINIGDDPEKPVDNDKLVAMVAAVLRLKKDTSVLIRGDAKVEYEKVVTAMTLLQRAGAPSVGLITQTPEPERRKRKK